eukprot:1626980-Amphidinium_carterae.1
MMLWNLMEVEDAMDNLEHCQVHAKQLAAKEAGRLRIHVAGVSCTAWSHEGLQEQSAHASETILAAWIAERVHMLEQNHEDLIFVECTTQFPCQQRLEAAFSEVMLDHPTSSPRMSQ